MHLALVFVAHALTWWTVDPEGNGSGKTTITIDGDQLTVEAGSIKKTFGKDITDMVVRMWGSRDLSVASWRSDRCVPEMNVQWFVDQDKHEVVLCKDVRRIAKLADLDSIVSALLW